MQVNKISLYFDPVCPWTYISSKWLRQVSKELQIPLEFRPFSLALKNKGVEVPPEHKAPLELGLSLLRVVAELGKTPSGVNQDLISNLYKEFGRQFHENKMHDLNFPALLAKFEIDPELYQNLNNDELDKLIELEMETALSLTGDDVGVPILCIETDTDVKGFFGPILCRMPTGSEVLDLWEHIIGLSSLGCFFEIKRKKVGTPIF